MPQIKRAIISVTDKTGIVEFGKFLQSMNVEILSTGGTAKVLREAGVKVVDVSEYTGSPEILDGRLKTIHPKIEGGLLGIRSNPKHLQEMKANDIHPIDMVIVNLYEFEKTVAKPGVHLEEAIENIDIGGPTMLRAAAKNHPDVTVVADFNDYPCLIEEMKKSSGSISSETNFKLAVKVFQKTAQYDSAISNYLTPKITTEGFPDIYQISLAKVQDLRYGENPHQKAAFYKDVQAPTGSLVEAKQIHGKELSFNNLLDLEAALNCVREFSLPACVIVKHTNPCGVAVGKDLAESYVRAKEADPVSCFGGIIGLNRVVDPACAQAISETFYECIIAPGFEPAALKILEAKKNIRLMVLAPVGAQFIAPVLDIKRVGGGLLLQDKDLGSVDIRTVKVVSQRKPTEQEYNELDFAWKVAKHVKSNAIVFTKDGQTLGVGAGQMSRVDSVNLAVMKAKKSLKGSVLASDAFFPFRDGLDAAAKQGITAVIQPGGSVKDEEVIQAANEHGLAMIFTGMRHFRH
ncbi:MAG TPA: bifunctional phosphoribosylaminoimidazolecarboxamide formyltransferase/inosine monophosphate cyclohydrolase [Deltaproteobacteria bacterium]|nr:MAG: bifunctional phosphoribosylaminoimidazolecarboxamide formyltransferase/IMP cyclohydrolase [Deltaproteobacteria bacterium GWA2_45_12]HBF13633.1 bifunctional phosphoribosylaminoimidazolecarboxamide formyltransferase/inosine monophosphate cyclohydrolase [Deltaproteobacteria bacterium]